MPLAGATTFVPAYATLVGPVVARGGPNLADIGVVPVSGADGSTTLAMARDARAGLGLATGTDRLIGRIARPIYTKLGTNILNPGYGTDALPGLLLTQQLPLQVADAAMREAQISQAGVASPSARVTRVTATATRLAQDPTTIALDIAITTADGAVVTGQLDF